MKVKTNVNGLKAMVTAVPSNSLIFASGTIGGIVNRSLGPLNGVRRNGLNNFYSFGFLRAMVEGGEGGYTSYGLYFMKGAVPSTADFDTWYGTGATDVTADSGIFRSTDLLLKYVPSGGNWNNGNLVTTFNPTAATGTGTATWYMFGGFQCTIPVSYNSWARSTDLLIGTVSSIGGGGDIELLNTSIVSGTTYRIPQYEMRLPTKFNV